MLSKCARTWSRAALPRVAPRALNRVSGLSARPLPVFNTQARGFASESHDFKAETKKLLQIVANSLYTDKEIFVRELISNASDALEKLRFLQSTHQVEGVNDEALESCIRLSTDESKNLFIIEDSGVGMTRDQAIDCLGTIAKSGTLEFLETAADKSTDMIGQFGVGFYSTFVVADKVEVFTKTCDPTKGEQGWKWTSDGFGSYTMEECDDVTRGTKIILHLKDDATQFARMNTVKETAKKFSNFVNFPIKLIEGGEEKELNKQEAIWLKQKATEEEHIQFYQYLQNTSYGEPFYTLSYRTDAPLSIQSVFYVPEDAPSRWFQQEASSGVALHSRRVMVTKSADKIMPRWLYWVKGVVDCEDMPLNVSRENMQDSRLLEKLSAAVVRRVLRFLEDESRKDPEKYTKFFKNYAYYLKAGLLEDQQLTNGRHKEAIIKLLRFECSQEEKGKVISLPEYIESCKEEQKNIYYLYSSSRETAFGSPFMEAMNKRGRNVLIFTDDIDEFVSSAIAEFKGKKLISLDATDADFELELDAPPEEADAEKEDNGARTLTEDEQNELEDFLKQELGEQIQAVKFTSRLTDSPAIVTSQLSPHLRKMMKQMMQGQEGAAVPVTLEVNPKHHLISTMIAIKSTNPAVARVCAQAIYDNARIAAGMVEEPKTLLTKLNKMLEVCLYQGADFDYKTGQYREGEEPKIEEPKFTEEPANDTKVDDAKIEFKSG